MENVSFRDSKKTELWTTLTDACSKLTECGMLNEAMLMKEQKLSLLCEQVGINHHESKDMRKKLIHEYNSMAMRSLAVGKTTECMDLIKRSERFLHNSDVEAVKSFRVLLKNNLACCYRRLDKPKEALRLLEEAIQIGSPSSLASDTKSKETIETYETHGIVDNLAVTYMNKCAILSQLGKHRQAAESAKQSIFHCQQNLIEAHKQFEVGDKMAEKYAAVAVAFHNMAVELEFLHDYDHSLQWYKQAYLIVKMHVPSNAPMLATFKKEFSDARKLYVKKRRQQRLAVTSSILPNRLEPFAHKFRNFKPILPQLDRNGTAAYIDAKAGTVEAGLGDMDHGKEEQTAWDFNAIEMRSRLPVPPLMRNARARGREVKIETLRRSSSPYRRRSGSRHEYERNRKSPAMKPRRPATARPRSSTAYDFTKRAVSSDGLKSVSPEPHRPRSQRGIENNGKSGRISSRSRSKSRKSRRKKIAKPLKPTRPQTAGAERPARPATAGVTRVEAAATDHQPGQRPKSASAVVATGSGSISDEEDVMEDSDSDGDSV